MISEYESNSDTDTDGSIRSSVDEASDPYSSVYSESEEDSDEELIIGTIIGINKPTLSYKSPPLLFYVRIHGQSYKSCEWLTKDEVCKSRKGEFLYNIFASKHRSFQQFKPFKTNDSFAGNKKFNLYLPFNSTFDEGHITPEFIISSRKSGRKVEFLIKWLSLDVQQSTWEIEDEVPLRLITEFNQRKKNPHLICYDPTINENDAQFKPFKESPIYKNGNKLTDYQIDGLNWLQMCWFQHKNSILSDEMGLGKTIESISILVFLSICYKSWGPFLVVCPLSTVPNWIKEFKKWTDFRVVSLCGDKKSRKIIKENLIYNTNKETNELDKDQVIFDVLVVSYEWLNSEQKFIKQFNFMYTIIDEAQRIKNARTIAFKNCRSIRSYHFLLMTGTPIQNNLFEIWSLLHFIMPSQFNDFNDFESKYDDKENPETIEKLQEVLQPFIFRRKKNDINLELPEKEEIIVEVEMTQIQRTFSQLFFKDNYDVLKETFNKVNLNNLMMQLRKLYCHPFLFPNIEEICYSQYKEAHNIPLDAELSIDDEIKSLVLASGKTILIDKLLPKLKEGNHKVLLFSQFTSVLDIIEDYLTYKCYPFERLDGQYSTLNRSRSIDKFQNDQESFIFLLSTRAGGLGINLTKADTVIIYDSDWNPQNDIQAQARCHRIGQSQKVSIYRLITRGSYESEMFSRASKKLALDYAILDSAPKGNDAQDSVDDKKELEMILKKGAYYTFKDDSNEINKFCSENIDQILENRSYTVKDVVSGGNSKFSKVSFEASSEADFYKNDFWDKLIEKPKESEDSNEIQNPDTKMVTRKKLPVVYFEKRKRRKPEEKAKEVKIKEIKIKDEIKVENIVHFSPDENKDEDDTELKNLKLADFCDLESFNKSIDMPTYEKALYTLRYNGIGCSSFYLPKSIHNICKTLVIFTFFGMPVEYRKIYYPYVKEFIPDFSLQLKKTPFKELTENFALSVNERLKLKIMDEVFNWDILYKIGIYITNEKLPDNFLFALEMPPYQGWTPIEDFNAIRSYILADKHINFIEDKNLPFKSMIENNPSMKSWILERVKLIFYEIYHHLPKDFSIYKSADDSNPKKIGDIKKFAKLNRHVLYPQILTIHEQKKLLRILYFYGIPKFNVIKKIKKLLNDEFVSDELILIFIVKILFKSMKYHRDLSELLKSLPKFNFDLLYKNDRVNISWIKETAIIAVASNLHLIFKVRKNYQILNSGKYKNIETKLGKWVEIGESCSWWDYPCDIVLFNITAFYGFYFNSMLCNYLIPNKPNLFKLINEDVIKDWKEMELLNFEPIVIKKVEFINPILSFELKEKRVRQINDLIEDCQKSKKIK